LLKSSKIALSLRVAVAMPTEALAQASHKFLHTATFANKTKVEWGRKVVENGFLGFQTTKMVLCWNGKWNRVQLKIRLANADTEVEIKVL